MASWSNTRDAVNKRSYTSLLSDLQLRSFRPQINLYRFSLLVPKEPQVCFCFIKCAFLLLLSLFRVHSVSLLPVREWAFLSVLSCSLTLETDPLVFSELWNCSFSFALASRAFRLSCNWLVYFSCWREEKIQCGRTWEILEGDIHSQQFVDFKPNPTHTRLAAMTEKPDSDQL